MAECHRVQCCPEFLVVDGAFPLRVGQHGPQIAQGEVRHLGQEHRVTITVWTQHRAGGIRPQSGDAAQQSGLPAPGRAGDRQRFTRFESQVEVTQQNPAVGIANLDIAQVD